MIPHLFAVHDIERLGSAREEILELEHLREREWMERERMDEEREWMEREWRERMDGEREWMEGENGWREREWFGGRESGWEILEVRERGPTCRRRSVEPAEREWNGWRENGILAATSP